MAFHVVEYLQVSVFPESHSCLVFRWNEKKRILPIWISPVDAIAQQRREAEIPPRRPRFEDLFLSVSSMGEIGFKELRITSFYEGEFIAALITESDFEIDCRPSDGIAIAHSLDLPILVDEEVLMQASVYVSEADMRQWFGLDFGEDITETGWEASASGDAAADADFSALMESMGVRESDLLGKKSDTDTEKDGGL
ncbi:hypothetical protein CMUST_07825 [Corynebacterium mustelae]|uniref:BFN domain-containing protein n=1 Tax=Corynebacterium mustelae TaxID=571915 RepID=A0A0G3GZD6_9CORY|nr:bifunctional nuclease family protein [Corynebacterium mustelae]AKK05890.1 hypothetical protein CMUST_07825 [Corynebacterium mustelae]